MKTISYQKGPDGSLEKIEDGVKQPCSKEEFEEAIFKFSAGYSHDALLGYVIHTLMHLKYPDNEIAKVLDQIGHHGEDGLYNHNTESTLKIAMTDLGYSKPQISQALVCLKAESFDWLTVEEAAALYRESGHHSGPEPHAPGAGMRL